MPYLNISYNFFMPIITKRQPLHRSSMQSPHTIAAIFVFYVIAERVHTVQKQSASVAKVSMAHA